jgi:hypothetical protein
LVEPTRLERVGILSLINLYSIDGIFHGGYILGVRWDVEYTDEFGVWWGSLCEEEQESLAASVRLLEECGPELGFPHSSGLKGSRHEHIV